MDRLAKHFTNEDQIKYFLQYMRYFCVLINIVHFRRLGSQHIHKEIKLQKVM